MKTKNNHQQRGGARATAGTENRNHAAAIKIGLDIHAQRYVVVVQHDHATPKPARRFAPGEFVPWVAELLAKGHRVHIVYEACGFGFGLCRELRALGAECHVIAPFKLDESGKRVKTDALDAATLCQRLSRFVEGNVKELPVIRVPSEEEERRRHVHRQRESLVRARTKMQAQGRGLLINHGQAALPRWWRARAWSVLEKSVPAWLMERLEVWRPLLAALDAQISKLSAGIEAAAPAGLPSGMGKLTSVSVSREVCDWTRFNNRRQVSSYTGLCPSEFGHGRIAGLEAHHPPRGDELQRGRARVSAEFGEPERIAPASDSGLQRGRARVSAEF